MRSIRSFFVIAGLLACIGAIAYHMLSTALRAISVAFLSWNVLQQMGFCAAIIATI